MLLGKWHHRQSAGKVTVHVVRSVANEKMEVDFATEGRFCAIGPELINACLNPAALK